MPNMKWTVQKHVLRKWMADYDWNSTEIAVRLGITEDRLDKLLSGEHWYAQERLALLALTEMKTLDLFDCQNTSKSPEWAIFAAVGDLLSKLAYETVFTVAGQDMEAEFDQCKLCKAEHVYPHKHDCPLVNLLDAIDQPTFTVQYCPACDRPAIPGAIADYDGCMQEDMRD